MATLVLMKGGDFRLKSTDERSTRLLAPAWYLRSRTLADAATCHAEWLLLISSKASCRSWVIFSYLSSI
ncbi:hypothetical protein D3C75_1312330 [compost metagenome]